MPIARPVADSLQPRARGRTTTQVFIRELKVDAEIGIHDHEIGRTQPLVIDVELDVALVDWTAIDETVNYEVIAASAKAIAAGGHIDLVESFALQLAERCLEHPRVTRARVRIEKPFALAPAAAAAGVEITIIQE